MNTGILANIAKYCYICKLTGVINNAVIMRQRIVEWGNGVNKFHLEYYCEYDEKWRLRLFESGLPCVFKTFEEAKKYSKEKPVLRDFVIHNL